IAKNDKKIRIEVGYGLEGKLTDLIAGRIIDGIITPAFKKGQFEQGIVAGIEAMIGTVRGEYNSENLPASNSNGNENDPGGIISVLIFVFIFLKGVAKKHSLVAAGVGAVVTPIAGFIFGFTAWPVLIIFAVLGTIIGLIAGMVPSSSLGRTLGRGRSSGSGRSGRSSGRFGGGGGGFGGGGASGGW
ncbi:MAG: TPM domain-containing protein, partial [Psychromonas sp.]